MKKRIRHISVEGNSFSWRVNSLDENYVSLRIWVEGQKRMPWFTVLYPYRDPWLNFAQIVEESGGSFTFEDNSILQGVTPGKIAKIISYVLSNIEKPQAVEHTLDLEWDSENQRPKFTKN
jgi:hypothetical protein